MPAVSKTIAKTRRNVMLSKYPLPKLEPIIPPPAAAAIQSQTLTGNVKICA